MDAHITKGDCTDVLCLRLEKPRHWKRSNRHQSGMYAFIQIPAIRRFEWHPFTITSRPNDAYLEFHIQKEGRWTAELHHRVSDVTKLYLLQVKVDGPYTRVPSTYVPNKSSSILMLIGGGIGVTPMMSIIKGLAAVELSCEIPERVFLYWVVRDPRATEWFAESLRGIGNSKRFRRVFRARYFLTKPGNGIKRRGQPRSNVRYDNDPSSSCLHTVPRCHQHRGQHELFRRRPNWRAELKHVQMEAKMLGYNQCKVFVCGPEGMPRAVEQEAELLNDVSDEGGTTDTFQFLLSKEMFV
jgi:NADPH oxidase